MEGDIPVESTQQSVTSLGSEDPPPRPKKKKVTNHEPGVKVIRYTNSELAELLASVSEAPIPLSSSASPAPEELEETRRITRENSSSYDVIYRHSYFPEKVIPSDVGALHIIDVRDFARKYDLDHSPLLAIAGKTVSYFFSIR